MSAPTGPAVGGTGDITVRRCTVTVVRRGGWSWGPDPRGLIRQVVDALPELLADHFAERLAGDGPDVEITEPLTVTVRQGRPGGPGRPPGGDPPVEVHFAPVPVVEVPAEPPAADAASLQDAFAESFAAEPEPRTVPGAAALFAELAERGELDALLALLPDETLRTYLLALLGADDPAAARLLADSSAAPSRRARAR
ncbi:hypothetical protein SPAR_26111, partial [Streptomyces sparsogenes DSM 40356]